MSAAAGAVSGARVPQTRNPTNKEIEAKWNRMALAVIATIGDNLNACSVMRSGKVEDFHPKEPCYISMFVNLGGGEDYYQVYWISQIVEHINSYQEYLIASPNGNTMVSDDERKFIRKLHTAAQRILKTTNYEVANAALAGKFAIPALLQAEDVETLARSNYFRMLALELIRSERRKDNRYFSTKSEGCVVC